MMGGDISAQSTVGKGTSFKGYIRCDAYKGNIEDNKASVDLTPLSGLNLLLAEDNIVNQKVAKGILNKQNINIDIADNGAIAVNRFNEFPNKYQVILMDIDMPVMDGYDATKLIRENPLSKDTPIIAMTAHAIEGIREKCLAIGMSDYVSKPIIPSRLYKTLLKYIA